MAVRRGKPVAHKAAPASAKRGRPAAKRTPAKVAPAPVKSTRGRKPMDITEYATKEPTDYHKAFARWIKDEVGFDPNSVSPMKAFLMGVSISTAARAKFMESEFLAAWREKTGDVKRGPKATSRPVDDDDDFEDDEESEELEDSEEDDDFDDESDEDEDDDFDDEEDDDESEEDDEEEDDDDFEDDDDEDEEPEPPARTKRPVKKSSGASRTRPNARSTTKSRVQSAKSTSKRGTSDDDEMLF